MLTSNGYVLDDSPARLGALQPVPDEFRQDKAWLWNQIKREGYLYMQGFLSPAIALYDRLGWRGVDHGLAGWTTHEGHRPPIRIYVA
ncbi:hypothetical protein GCM10027403_16830 [Arthrobacter tecti]